MRSALIAFMLLVVVSAASAEEWQELKSEHFKVFYFEDAGFAQNVLTNAEKYYDRIASDLGYSRYDNFWQWDNRAKIYIYRTHEDFLRATGKSPWIHGAAAYSKREITSYKWGQDFIDVLLPHELTHLIFRDFVGFKGEVPLWLDEGVAQWEELRKRKWAISTVKSLIRKGAFIPLAKLTKVGPGSEDDPALSAKLYAQAATLVGYLIEKQGSSRFALFCRNLRDGKSMDEALSSVYTDSIRNTGELEKEWLKYYGGE